ncbi:MAG: Yip1 family protein [Symbiobacterium sp.]|uniref:Yip1 family protein n=1 Tax=Symbiobacterium sp. TaxID=1971213 RepID=UPI003464B913
MMMESYERNEPKNRSSVWDLILDVITAPKDAMARIASERPVKAAALLVIGIALFTAVLGFAGTRDAMVAQLDRTLAGLPGEAQPVMEAFLGQMAAWSVVLGAVGTVLWWFLRAAVYGLIGEMMGGARDGRAMLATLGFALTPAWLQAPLNLMLGRLGLTWLAILLGLGFWIWTLVLTVMAIRAALGVDTGKAVVVFLIPVGVGIALATLVIVLFVAAMVSAAVHVSI